jgi:hypothetical protein
LTGNGGGGSGCGSKTQLQVLRTHQKTKKKKSWKDGRLPLVGTRCLYDACPVPGGSSGGILSKLELNQREADGLIDGCSIVDERTLELFK